MPDEIGEILEGKFKEVKDRSRDSDKYKLSFAAASAGIAGYAAVDQMFDGNSEAADILGHYALGVAGALSGEMSYRLSGLEEEYGRKPKYVAMMASGVAVGGAGQASQYFISGVPELESLYQSAVSSLWTTTGQIGAESHER